MNLSREQSAADFRVGLMSFLALALIILGITFAGGDKGLAFQKSALVKVRLKDVGGLKKGSTVTMGGMAVGRVVDIAFDPQPGADKPPIQVMLRVRQDMRAKIKNDSVPCVRTQGMLGDRYLEITMGTAESGSLADGECLHGAGAADFDKALEGANNALAETTKMLAAINTQAGSAGQLIYNKEFYENLNRITEEMRELIKDFKEHPKKYVKLSMF